LLNKYFFGGVMVADFSLIKNILIFTVIFLLVIIVMNWKILRSKDENFFYFFEMKKV